MAKKTSSDIAKEALSGEKAPKKPEVVVEEIPKDLSDAKLTEADNPEHAQPDLVPLYQRKDPTFFPGCSLQHKDVFVYDHALDRKRRLGLPGQYVYQFWPYDPAALAMAITEGWKFCKYNGGSLSGLADKGFKDTHLYQEEAGTGRVVLGDTYLMYIPMRLAELLKEEEEHIRNAMEGKPNTDFFNDAYKSGIRGFTEDDFGNKVYN